MPDHPIPSQRADRRSTSRWRDKRLLTVREAGGEHPGMTADISPTGMRVALSRCASRVGEELHVSVAFAQEVVEVHGHLVHTRHRPWGVVAGIRFAPGQEELCRFLTRRYPPPAPRPLSQPAPAGTPAATGAASLRIPAIVLRGC